MATLGLIAGRGRFPLEVARSARKRGVRVVAVGYESFADPELDQLADEVHWLPVGQLGKLLDTFRAAGVEEAVLAGQVPKERLYADPGSLQFDALALGLLARLQDRKDHSILGAVADLLEEEGLRLRPQDEWIPDLMAGVGHLAGAIPAPEQLADVAFGWEIAKQSAALQLGQTVVVKQSAVLAVEAIEGTDAAIRRGGSLGGPGACVVKVAKPGQDPRFDLPTIGITTVEAALEVGVTTLAVEAGRTVVLDADACGARAEAGGLALWGVAPDGPERAA